MGWNHQLVLYINMNFLNMMVSLIWFQGWGLYIWSTLSEVVANAGCGGGLTKPPERHYNIWGIFGGIQKIYPPTKKCLIEVYVPYDSFHIYTRYPGKNERLEGTGTCWVLFDFFFVNKGGYHHLQTSNFWIPKTQVGDFKATKIFRTLRHSCAVVGDFATGKSGENMEVSAAAVVQQVGEFHVLRCWKKTNPVPWRIGLEYLDGLFDESTICWRNVDEWVMKGGSSWRGVF